MILDLDTTIIDIDSISAVMTIKDKGKKFEIAVCLGNGWLSVHGDKARAVLAAYRWKHRVRYDKNLKKIGGE